MIYNLIEYLKTNLPALNFVINGFNKDSPSSCIVVKDTGGEEAHNYNRGDHTVQVLSRAHNNDNAKYNIEQVYSLLKNVFNLLLPSVMVNSRLYAAVQTYQISPIQKPQYLGVDNKNLELYDFNLIIVTD
ncbi:MAG: minor capsid protein [Candidatus Lokiarchaeota archaeon]